MYKERCRISVFKTMCKSGLYAKDAIEAIEYFEQEYNDLRVKDYIIKMKNLELSYVLNKDLSRKDRIIFVDGMEFAYDSIGIITNNDLLIVPDEIQLDYINRRLEKQKESYKVVLNEHDEEIFKLGILSSCSLYFNIIDTKNIISKSR